MAFTPPGLPTLRVNTLNLDSQFGTKLGRYKIVNSSVLSSSSIKRQSSLEILIARTQHVIVCKTERISARDVFSNLVNELNEIVKAEKKEQYNSATMFLLGALLHRYFRLIKEYDDFNSYAYFFSPSSVTNCKLFKAIRLALQLPDEMSFNFREGDLKIIDVTTIVTALEVFRDNMKVLDENKIPRYKKYPHLEKDRNFENYLQDIIDVHKKRGIPLLNQYKAIDFIQSLALKVDAECQQIEEELGKWSKILEKDYPNFSQLSQEKIEKHILAHIKPESLSKKIHKLMQLPLICENFETLNHTTFLDLMKKCQMDTASYTIFGGYALILQSPQVDQLKFCIYQALDIVEDPHELTEKDMLVGINRFLIPFLRNNPDIEIDCEFFDGKDNLDTHIFKALEGLTTKIKSEENVERVLLV